MNNTEKFIEFMDKIKSSDNESLIESIKQGHSAIFTESISVKVTFDDGDHLTTRINTDLEGAKKYYLGKSFTFDGSGEEEIMKEAVKVEEI